LEEDEVIPSDEIEIIPSIMLSGKHCLLGALPDGTADESDSEEMGGIHWKRSHVYISETATVMVCMDEISFTNSSLTFVDHQRSLTVTYFTTRTDDTSDWSRESTTRRTDTNAKAESPNTKS